MNRMMFWASAAFWAGGHSLETVVAEAQARQQRHQQGGSRELHFAVFLPGHLFFSFCEGWR
jgi:hypothetical protein